MTPSPHPRHLPNLPCSRPFIHSPTQKLIYLPLCPPIIHTYTFYTHEHSLPHSFPHPSTYPPTCLPNSSSDLFTHASEQSSPHPPHIHSPIQQTTVNQTPILPHWLK